MCDKDNIVNRLCSQYIKTSPGSAQRFFIGLTYHFVDMRYLRPLTDDYLAYLTLESTSFVNVSRNRRSSDTITTSQSQ